MGRKNRPRRMVESHRREGSHVHFSLSCGHIVRRYYPPSFNDPGDLQYCLCEQCPPRRPSGYWKGIRWIVENDEPDLIDAVAMSGYASVHALAAAFDASPKDVARDVIRKRRSGWPL